MKPKHHFPLVILNIPFLLLSPAVQAQDTDPVEVEIADKEQTEEEKTRELIAKEAAKLQKEAEKAKGLLDKEAAEELAKETAERERAAVALARENARNIEKAAKQAAKDAQKDAAELEKEKAEIAKEHAEEARESGQEKAEIARKHAEEARKRGLEKADEAKQRADEAAERNKERSESAKERAKREAIAIKASEPERMAETKVTEVTRELQLDIDKRKARIEDREQARAMYNEILGAESRISQAEIAREERFRQRFEAQRQSDNRIIRITPDQRRLATTYYQERLLGREVDSPQPEFFRQSAYYEDRHDGHNTQQVQYANPYYLNEGRRYVHYDSRSSIPAILMAALAMNQVQFQPAREIAPIFHERRRVSSNQLIALPPENYRGENSWVVSYPVDEKSMISSEDILFLQGTTQFADPYSYEVVKVMADAMKAVPEDERFVIEGHASAEGSYESNMVLSQQRAELIVREIVRQGVSPYRLLPVGYGESEARRSADSVESLRSQDRRVVVFRMKPETIARR